MPLTHLRFRHIEVFKASVRTGSMLAAGRSLGLTQPAVSKLIAELEANYGAPLLERSKRGVVVTECGAAFLRRADLILNELALGREESDAISTGVIGNVRIGVLPVVAARIIPATLLRLLREAPGMTIQIEEGTTTALLDALKRGEVDCVAGRLDPSAVPGGLQEERIVKMPIRIVVRPGHPVAKLKKPQWQHLSRYSWIAPRVGSPVRSVIDAEFASMDLPAPKVVFGSISAPLNSELLRHSDLIGVLGDDAAREYARTKQLAILPVPVTQPLPHVGLIMRLGSQTKALATFVNAFRKECEKATRTLRAGPH